MDFWVANPDWGLWIIAYFFFGGIAAGSYFVAILIEWFGAEEDRALARIAYLIAFPLLLLCTVCLIADLNRPERFWHMMLKSEVTKEALKEGFPFSGAGWSLAMHAPAFKYWSPMSAGSWGLAIFGACSFVSFLTAVWPKGWPDRLLTRMWPHLVLQIIGSVCGFFVASYTGALLSASNQPLWSDTTWLSPLFLASAASTSVATMTLIARWKHVGTPAGREHLGGAELVLIGLEFLVLGIFAISLGDNLMPVLSTVHGKILFGAPLLLGVAAPLLLHAFVAPQRGWGVPTAAACVLVGGLLLRYAAVTTPPEILARGPAISARSAPDSDRKVGTPEMMGLGPEVNRKRGEPGADIDNRRSPDVMPRTKLPFVQPAQP
jgi:protein NrfD